ncbi:MAG: DUF1343 domain-containing protein [Deltaproteobacteria bacterium]|nr:DUF1343 domain-containing protein [Deltaproteobacteria bacterium]MBW2534532.1 DUF1343 domain-containing protein [Deltaproteobacteria bacterium]
MLAACSAGAPPPRRDPPPAPASSSAPVPAASTTVATAKPTASAAANEARPPAVSLGGAAEARIDAVVQGCMARGEVPGAVVIVLRRHRVAFRRAYGWRRVEPERTPMTVDTLFDLASLTKPVATAAAVALLVDQGRLSPGAPVGRYLKALSVGDKRAVTVEQLVEHTSGLPPGLPPAALAQGLGPGIDRIAQLPLRHPPGSKRLYSDLGYIVLGALVEQVAGEPLDAIFRSRIAEPLGMAATRFLPTEPLAARAAPTDLRHGGWLTGTVHDPSAAALGGVAGHAGLFATADDLARFAAMMLGRGQLGDRRLLAPESVAWLGAKAWRPYRGGIAHTGFTGTYLWLHREREDGLIALASRLHPGGRGDAGPLRRELVDVLLDLEDAEAAPGGVQLGIDRLVATQFAALRGRRVGLVTNHTGRTRDGRRTIDVLHAEPTVRLEAIFTPEHGLAGTAEGAVRSGRDDATGLVIHSLYGSRKRPRAEQLSSIDTLVFDLQDVGTRFYTYISTLGYLLETAAAQRKRVVVLDRPNPVDGVTLEGPILDAGRESFIGYHRIPVRHGMTVGELAKLFNAERRIGAELEVVAMTGWRRTMGFGETGLPWRNTSPNIRSPTAALLYPGLGLLEATNLSVGRGTSRPFEQLGAPWLDAHALAKRLAAASLPGVRFAPVAFTPRTSVFGGKRCDGLTIRITDPRRFRAVRTGLEIAVQLRALHPDRWRASQVNRMLGSRKAQEALMAGAPAEAILATWRGELERFRARRQPFLLYR